MTNSKGFSLVELAIVLVVMGLLVAGTLGGAELIKSAKLRAVISEIEKYKVAVESFKQQYEGLPGDLKNAASFFGQATDCTTPYTDEAGTCNGNGDGKIGSGATTDDTEPYTEWDQLALAKMIPGSYSGAGTEAVVGVNVPASAHIDGAGYSLTYHANPWSYTDALGRGFPGNYFMLGKSHATRNDVLTAAVISEDTFYMDSKIDDGTPDFGKILAGTGTNAVGTCVSGSAPDIIYNLGNSSVACTPMFLMF